VDNNIKPPLPVRYTPGVYEVSDGEGCALHDRLHASNPNSSGRPTAHAAALCDIPHDGGSMQAITYLPCDSYREGRL
jgi:hypothetical protein